jgi:Ca2+-binding EF-hand superfamily protein
MKRFVILSMIGMVALAWNLAVAPAPASAAEGKKKKTDLEALFKKLDTNNDGKLSKEEFAKIAELGKKKGAKSKRIDQLFQKLDTNNDGSLSLEEFKKIREVRAKKNKKTN